MPQHAAGRLKLRNTDLSLSLKLFVCRADAEALPRHNTIRRDNRGSLVAGLQSDCMEVTFRLGEASKPEFTLLCKAMEVQGPIVRAVHTLNSYEAWAYEAWALKPFMASLRYCTGLRELK